MFKCHFCVNCNGKGCLGEMPGMGGPEQNSNFIANCQDWEKIPFGTKKNIDAELRLAPITGAVENIGWETEKDFYPALVNMCIERGIKISLGDGTPDEKLLYGIEAAKNAGTKAAVFIKPYPQEKLLERIEWALPVAEIIGIDIDSYNIITMRNLVNLEKKTTEQLLEIKEILNAKKIPFAIKGIFTEEDLELVEKVKPSIAYISNHGGRVETRHGSTAEFLAAHADRILASTKHLWIDGGIRCMEDIEKACSWGCDTILLGRPLITDLCKNFKSQI